MQIPQTLAELGTLALAYGIRVIEAAAIFVIGRWVARIINRLLERLLTSREIDVTLTSFVCNLTHIAMLVFIVIAALNQLGIQTASFVAIIGAAGLAIGLALQGSLSNFAAGVLMIIFRPFNVGDYIQAAGASGTVEAIQIFTTRLRTPDNKITIIPNSKVFGDHITNFSTKHTRRMELVFRISYNNSIDRARRIILDTVNADKRVLHSPEPLVRVSDLAESSVNLTLFVWCTSDDLPDLQSDTLEKVKKAFDAAGIKIPFPQQHVPLHGERA